MHADCINWLILLHNIEDVQCLLKWNGFFSYHEKQKTSSEASTQKSLQQINKKDLSSTVLTFSFHSKERNRNLITRVFTCCQEWSLLFDFQCNGIRFSASIATYLYWLTTSKTQFLLLGYWMPLHSWFHKDFEFLWLYSKNIDIYRQKHFSVLSTQTLYNSIP